MSQTSAEWHYCVLSLCFVSNFRNITSLEDAVFSNELIYQHAWFGRYERKMVCFWRRWRNYRKSLRKNLPHTAWPQLLVEIQGCQQCPSAAQWMLGQVCKMYTCFAYLCSETCKDTEQVHSSPDLKCGFWLLKGTVQLGFLFRSVHCFVRAVSEEWVSVITLAVFINSKSPDTPLRSLSAPGVKLRGWFEAEGYFCAALSCLSVGRRLCEQGSLCAMKEHVLRGSNKLEQANRYPDSYPGRLKLSLSLLGLNEISINRI